MAKREKPGKQAPVDASSSILALDAPDVPAVMDPDDPKGLLPLSALGDDLVVTFKEFGRGTAAGEQDLVELGFMPRGMPFRRVDHRWYPTEDVLVFPQSLKIPKDEFSHGVHEVALRISLYGTNPFEGERKVLTIDTIKPNFGNKPNAVIFPAELGGIINESFLSQEGEVRVDVPWYNDVEVGDRAVYFWTSEQFPPDTETPIREQEFSAEDINARRLRITVYADEIRAWGSGIRYLYYYLRDRPGNEGPNSYNSPIEVDLSPAPGALPPPRVPLSVRGLVDREQARDGVIVQIPPYDSADSSHWAAIFWDDTPLTEVPVVPSDLPLDVPVPWSTLQAKGNGPLRAKVYYKIRQGTVYSPPSPEISVAVNLTVAGQDHANAPALINANLAKVEVYGEKTVTLNTLLTADHGFPATVKLALYDAPEPGQFIELFWGNYPGAVARYLVKSTDVAGAPIEFSVPWNVIDTDKQNPALPVHYTTHNGVNQQQSLPTPVKVAIVLIENLKEPIFPHGGRDQTLHCCSIPRLWQGVTVRIRADARIEQGDTLLLVWQGCYGKNGTDPIAGTYAEISKELTTLMPGEAIDIVVEDYDTLIAPMVNYGSALVHYRLEKRDGGRGKSAEDFVVINRTMPSGEICSPNRDLCNEN
ncbi:hypothetical protein [Pseudomonas sp. WC2]|uniref:hypothetical protein n=1 Tax=Pseudomonas sp. WC2 TaxID=3424773 RepID=UPI003D32C5EB